MLLNTVWVFFFFAQGVNIVGISVATFTSLGDLCLTKHVGNLLCLDDVTLMFKLKTLTDSDVACFRSK